MQKLMINGEEKEFSQGLPANVTELLKELSVDEATVVAEIDGTILKREEFATTALSDSQKIELVRFVPGG